MRTPILATWATLNAPTPLWLTLLLCCLVIVVAGAMVLASKR